MTINSQLSLHTRLNIVLELFLDRLKAYKPHFSKSVGIQKSVQNISTLNKRLRITSKYRISKCRSSIRLFFMFPVFSC